MDCCKSNKMESKVQDKSKHKKLNYELIVQIALISVLAIVLVFNAGKIYNQTGKGIATGIGIVSALDVLPKGAPNVYGTELGVTYDDVSANSPKLADATMQKLAAYEDMQLNSEQMERYVKIGSSIACEYCCGAQTLVFSNGERACGCAHSYAMRGLAKYLLTEHSEITDLEILDELAKWKVLFFPGIHEKKAEALKAGGVDYTNYVNLASNLYRGAENSATVSSSSSGNSQMVGGC
jgi:hypothetical protein